MPPKRLAYAQALRETFTEAESCAVVERWATEAVGHLERVAQHAAVQYASVQEAAYTSGNVNQTPAGIMSVIRDYQSLCLGVYRDAEVVRTVVSVRLPEIKEEDNLGVAVQHAIVRMLDELQNKTLGNGGSGEKNSGVKAQTGVYALREYLEARSGVEEKLLGKPGDGNEKAKESSKSPSLLLELRQVDADALLKVELSAMQLVSSMRSFINAYALNWKKLIEPRTGGDRMVS
ncbi:putative proteasome activator protein pa26 [Trypanosoma rangeli]|uniref:Putative proteasome activator protein pa26 n=1 Tax=Trypanosoma rangeli TaxID=5698 RepID=A0A3R7MG26_TRYRA|nr:putative proteasome activator protein pa26 [Trypanosoma rangeli]RNF05189.1 putative proteasome activator protein pa26 [Trypanosoma rangeli]|eukprot:RNF05189.1 putative proteasome activator protein pa26 [Trypanosoma rangeli]